MSYQRVIPRDLFNEAKLLKCLGQIALIVHDYPGLGLCLNHDQSEFSGFAIEQDDNSAELYCSNLELTFEGRLIGLRTNYNSKEKYPMTIIFEEECGQVFAENGYLDNEFKALMETIANAKRRKI